jgi:hypothetical protein
MKFRLNLVVTTALFLLLSGCGPSAEEAAVMTASAWTPTPPPTPTATPVPYDLIVHVADEGGAPLAGANIVVVESGSDKPVQTDVSGQYQWKSLPGPAATLKVSAPGYFHIVQNVTMERGSTELAVSLRRDPFGLLPVDACAPNEKLRYIEDFQDGKAQGWQKITAATDFAAQNGWGVGPLEEGNQVAYFTGIFHTLDDLQNFTFDNMVWRLKVRTKGRDGFSFLNVKHAPAPNGGETRYTVQWGANVLLDLGRLQLPDVGHFSVGLTHFQFRENQWYYLEISAYQGLIEVWQNGKPLVQYQDPKPLPPGTISLEANIQKDTKTAYYFDNLSVCELTAPFATSLYKPGP